MVLLEFTNVTTQQVYLYKTLHNHNLLLPLIGNQDWILTPEGYLKHQDLCLTLIGSGKGSLPVMRICDGSYSQTWQMINPGGLIRHIKYPLCLDTRYSDIRGGVTVEKCNTRQDSQKWKLGSIS